MMILEKIKAYAKPTGSICKSAFKPIVFIEKVVGIDCGFETFTLIVGFGIILVS